MPAEPLQETLARRVRSITMFFSRNPDDDALAFLYGRIDYERTPPASTREFKLNVMRTLLQRLGNPQDGQNIVHIAGTKGKGSTATMVAAILRQAGHRTALYTSPHLESITERLAIDGRPCSEAEFLQLVDLVRGPVADLDREAESAGISGGGPTFFDIVTALALTHFARRRCTATVLEVGLGGRLDSTNVCRPAVSVITTISFDHTQQLGNSLGEIAAEKAGIIKPGVPVVSGVLPAEPRSVIARVARDVGAPLFALGDAFHFREVRPPTEDHAPPSSPRRRPPVQPTQLDYWETGAPDRISLAGVPLQLRGAHQALNAAVALAAILRLGTAGWSIPEAALRAGLAQATCPARVEVVGERPTIILDAAHNVASIDALLEVLDRDFAGQPRIAIFAVNRDKDVAGILRRLLPAFPQVIVTQFHDSPRAMPVMELADLARSLAPADTRIEVASTPSTALRRARQLATPEHVLCATGSFFLAAELRHSL